LELSEFLEFSVSVLQVLSVFSQARAVLASLACREREQLREEHPAFFFQIPCILLAPRT
jgi:hypothetical protein